MKQIIHISNLSSLSYLSGLARGILPKDPSNFNISIKKLKEVTSNKWKDIPIKTRNYILNSVYNYLSLDKNLSWYIQIRLFIKGELKTYRACTDLVDAFIDECLHQIELENPYLNGKKLSSFNEIKDSYLLKNLICLINNSV